MVKTSGVKGFFGRTFCCSREVQDTPAVPEPAGSFTSKTQNINSKRRTEEAENANKLRRASAVSYKSCSSSIGSFRSLSCSSLQSTMSKTTGNYDFYSIYSKNSLGNKSFTSCDS